MPPSPPFRTATVLSGDRNFEYTIFNAATSRYALPPLVLVSGWGQAQEEWGRLPAELARRARRAVLTFDNQGLGASVDREGDAFTLESWRDDVLELAARAFGRGARFSVLGYSMGCFAAQLLAATRPERVESIVLIGAQGARPSAAAAGTDGRAWFRLAMRTLASGVDTLENNERRLRTTTTAAALDGVEPSDLAAAVALNLGLRRPAATIRKQLKLLGSADVGPLLERIVCPVLVVAGELDVIVPPANGRLLMAQLTSARRREFAVVRGRGHYCWGPVPTAEGAEAPAATVALAEKVREFLSDQPLGDLARL